MFPRRYLRFASPSLLKLNIREQVPTGYKRKCVCPTSDLFVIYCERLEYHFCDNDDDLSILFLLSPRSLLPSLTFHPNLDPYLSHTPTPNTQLLIESSYTLVEGSSVIFATKHVWIYHKRKLACSPGIR